ncbi:LamG-like jellyroll fold domain-containing protein [Actinoplanes siamensis]|uniref:LamG-like jellyroll fold domain-containing protein n=1 Tax=Actinoplanes siamensis TaxID=1223317 RepID=UPI0019423C43|nr:LamG-like jellyroll fold domain-containing protein [Actinoplanes siamensis]
MTVAAPVGAVKDPDLPVSWLWSWWSQRPAWALPTPAAPRQGHGDGGPRDASYADTKAHGGAGRPVKQAAGTLDAYRPYDPATPVGDTGPAEKGFDPKTSVRDQNRSTRLSDVFTNADGTVTTKTYPRPVNFRDKSGDWQRIDVNLTRQADGRLHAAANAMDTSVAASAGAAPPLARSATTAPAPTIANLKLPTGESVGYSLLGANPVTATVAGNLATYPGILPETDLELETFDAGIKETMVLRSPRAANVWTYPLTLNGLTPRVDATGGIELLDKQGKAVAWLPKGSMQDSKVDPRSGAAAESTKVTFSLVQQGGGIALRVEADRAWLNDPARVYPVRVDPTATTGTTGDVMVDNDSGTNNNGDNLPVGTYNGGTTKARSFIHLDDFDTDIKGKHVTAATLKLYLTWTYSCDTDRIFYVRKATSKWTVADLTASTSIADSPTYSAAIGSLTVTDPGAACTNTGGDRSKGKWVSVPLDAAAIDAWSKGDTNYGLALTASETDSAAWKRFTAANYSSGAYKPELSVTYSNNVLPQVDVRYPANNSVSSTLTPELLVKGHDSDNWPGKGLTYVFTVLSADGKTTIATSPAVASSWMVPAGKLAWNTTYLYTVRPYDQSAYGATSPAYAFTTNVAQPVVTSNLAQNGGKGFDSSIGNYTTSATDANISTVGPSLAINRSYNSLDTRTDTAFGTGWSSILDAKATQTLDVANTLQSVRVTYPTGEEVAFGRTSTGAFIPPSGRFSTFEEVKSGTTLTGYKLTDKDATAYVFGRDTGVTGAKVFRLTSVTDANGRALTIGYGTDGNPSTVTSASGRKLTVGWTKPTDATAYHVATVATDRVDANDANSVNTWRYGYTGDRLAQVCQPNDYQHCWAYGYDQTAQHGTTVLNLDPEAYWPFNEPAGATVAKSRVLSNAGIDAARYVNVNLGQAGPLAASGPTTAGFNGTSSYAQLPANLIAEGQYQSVSMWFNTSTPGGVLFSYNFDPIGKGSTTGNYTPALYIDKNGFLRGELWMGSAEKTMKSGSTVTDAKWHHVVLAGAGNSQTMYLDGVAQGTPLSGTIYPIANGAANINVGAGYVGGGWPDHANTGVSPAKPAFFSGSIADVAFYNQTLTAATVATLNKSGRTTQPVLSTVTRPSGGVTAKVSYDKNSGRVASVVDENGGTWSLAEPTVAGSSLVYAGAVLGAKPKDYWRLGDDQNATDPLNEVAGGTAIYNGVTVGQEGPFTDATSTAFDGATSYLELPADDIPTTGPNSVEMWFKMPKGSTKGGVLFGYQTDAIGTAATSGWTPALYVGTDGKLRGGLWSGAVANQITTKGTVNDGNWHHVALTASTTTQTLYLDGLQVDGPLAKGPVATTALHAYVGAGRWSGSWPAHGTADFGWWPGSIAEVAYYDSTLSAVQVADHVVKATQTAPVSMTMVAGTKTPIAMPVSQVTVTTPADVDGKRATQVSYFDLVNGNRIVAQTDERGKTTQYGYDVGGYSSMVWDPNGVLTQTFQDARGNTKQSVTCQDQSAKRCSSVYYTYYPDVTTTTLTPNPKNDLLLTVRGAGSTGESDNRYLTTNEYDAKGNLITVTEPEGRVTRTAFTDATTVAADGGTPPAGLPTKVTMPGGGFQTVTYFKSGDVAQVTEPAGKITKFTYDALGRVLTETEISSINPDGVTTTHSYDRLDREVSEKAPAVTNRVTGAVHTEVTTTVYDLDSNITEVRLEDATGGDAARVEKHGYNQYGQEISSTSPGGATTTFTFDSLGRVINQTSPDGTVTKSVYDEAGNLIETWLLGWTGDPNKPQAAADLRVARNVYDAAGRLVAEVDAQDWTTKHEYTDNGLEAKVVRTDGTKSFVVEQNEYDDAGNLLTEYTNNLTTKTTHAYDYAGRETSSTADPDGLKRTTSVVYDKDDNALTTTQSDASGSVLSKIEALYDKAGRAVAQTQYVSGSVSPVARWKLNDGTGTRAADSAGNSPADVTSGAVAWSSDGGGSAVLSGNGYLTSNNAVVDTRRAFTVSAWVKIADKNQLYRAVSGGGGKQQSPFDLAYDQESGRWRFIVVSDDAADTSSGTEALSTSTPAANTWTHLTGVYDPADQSTKLYVGGTLESTSTGAIFGTTGPVYIGTGMWNNELGNNLNGGIRDVQVYQQALSATDVKALAGGTLAATSSKITRTSYTYDEEDNVTSVTDPRGYTSYTSYDEDGNAVKSTAPAAKAESVATGEVTANAVSWTGYNTFGEVTDSKDALGNWSVTYYDADGKPTLQRSPSYTPPGETTPITPETTTTYTESGEVKTITDPFGNVTRYEYDQFDRMSKMITADGGETTYTYDKIGDLLTSTDPTGAVSATTWDYLGRQENSTQIVRAPSAASYQTKFEYDTNGQIAKVTSPTGVTRSVKYNALGETVESYDGANNKTTMTYDGLGRPTKTTLADNTYSTTTYDMAGQTVSSSEYSSTGTLLTTESSQYDAAGNLVAAVDARKHTTTYEYDPTGMLIKERQPINDSDAIETSFGYDLQGNRTRFTDGRGNAFWTTYNSWGLPESQIEPSTAAHPNLADRTFTVVYDKGGRVVKQQLPGGVSVSNSYDLMGQLTKQSGAGAEATTVDRTFGYDKDGRITKFSGVGGDNEVTYDDRGLATSINGPSGNSSFTYNGDGAMTSRTDAAGTTNYGYDTAGRLQKLTNSGKGVDATYSYDVLNSVKKIAYGTGNSRNFTYDDAHRLKNDDLRSSAGTSIAKVEYGWNENDDLTSKKTTGFGGQTISNTYTYDYADRLTSWNNGTATTVYAYDKSGNRVQNGSKLFTYDARNRLLTADTVNYNYTARGTLSYAGTTLTKADAFGQVISQGDRNGGTQTYQYDGLGRAVKDGFSYTGSDNDLAADSQATYVRGVGNEVIAETATSGGGTKLAWTDLHDDVVAQFTATGTALDGSTVYDPLGKVVANAGQMVGSLGYQSEWTDTATSRVNMMARWYNTDTGQFDTRDTVSNSPIGDSVNANRYQYGDANPLTVTDPTGHFGFGSIFKKATSFVSNTVRSVSSYVSYSVSSAYSYASATYHRSVSAVKATYHRTVKAVKKAAHRVVKKVKHYASKAKRYVKKQVAKVKKKVKKFVKAAVHKAAKITKAVVKKAKAAGKAVTAAAKRVAKNPVAAIKDAAKATKKFVVEHKDAIIEVAAIGAGILAGMACTAATAGAGAVACMVGASALVNLAKDAAQGNIHSFGDALGSLGTGALTGLIGGAGGAIAGKVGTLVAGKVGTGFVGRMATEAVENGVDEVFNQAVTTGRFDPRAAAMSMIPGLGAFAGGKKNKGGGSPLSNGSHASSGGGGGGGLPMATGLITGISGGARCHSFDPDTKVLMADGSERPIQDVNVGDTVVATDPETGKSYEQPVTQLHRNTDHEFSDVTVKDQDGKSATLNTTQNHPFWDETTKAWTEAKDLKPGDHLKVAGKGDVVVTAIHNHDGSKEMRDLTVAGVHTYYAVVGESPVLVHNNNPTPGGCGVTYGASRAPTTRGAAGKVPPVVTSPAAPQGNWSLDSRLDDAQDLLDKQMRAQHHPEQPMRRAWSGGVNTQTGEIAVGCSGGGFCAEGNVVNALGGDSSKVALLHSQEITSKNPFAAQPKVACSRCQQDYVPEQYPRGGYN